MQGQKRLEQAGIAEAPLDAFLLLEYITGISKAVYYAEPDRVISGDDVEAYLNAISRRAARIPLQHITGEQEFMGISFQVNAHVLIPRQDTETLVEEGLKKLKPGMQVLDLCTGSGCILISLALWGGKAGTAGAGSKFTGSDISQDALWTAKSNATFHQVTADFIQSDLFEDISGTFDMILSNPPYIRTSDIDTLQEEVRCYDPHIALDGKEDGLYFYRRIAEEGRNYLKDGGYLLFETGHDQGEAVSGILVKSGYTCICTRKDLCGLDRVVMGMYNRL